MTPHEREVMQQSLDALVSLNENRSGLCNVLAEIAALRACLAQPEHYDQAELEREACAKVCEEVGEHPSLTPRHCAEAIRARGD